MRGTYIGKGNPNYKDGRTLKDYYCIDCGKSIFWRGTRCPSCENKKRFKNKSYDELYGIKKAKQLKKSRSEAIKGIKRSKATKKKLSESCKGRTSAFKGKHHTKESKRKLSMSNGGTGIPYENSDYPEEFNYELKNKIRKRDSNICQMSGMTNEEHKAKYSKQLTVHHIDYNKQNCKESNLITLSLVWNIKVNYNRNMWKKKFKQLLTTKVEN